MNDHGVQRPARGVPADASALGFTAARGAEPGRHQPSRDEVPDLLAYWEQGGAGARPLAPGGSVRPERGGGAFRRLRNVRVRRSEPHARVGRRLARLARRGQRWRSLTEIPVGFDGGHIDHLVVGPGGVFTVDARSHPRSRISVRGNVFRVDGVPYPYISASRHEALRAARCLSAACGFPVEVTGLVVVTGVEEIVVEQEPAGVRVLADTALETWLRRREQRVDGPTLAAVYDAARRSTTWNQHGG